MIDSMLNIIPCIGVGEIIFGMTLDQVKTKLGIPDKEINPDEEGDIIYIYNTIGAFYFAIKEKFKLTSMELDVSPELMVFDTKIFNKYKNEILEIFNEREVEIDEMKDEEIVFETSIYFPNLFLTIFLNENDVSESISLGVMYNKNDEILWPQTKRVNIFD
ncbi:MAG: hypothetical protein HQK79_09575 [Desulfobacterales bacterium]|nr:hypothetical protein [Desulfobacterales bacterium]